MRRIKKNGLVFYRFEIFDAYPELTHGVFTSNRGLGFNPGRDLNLSYSAADSEAIVQANLARVASTLGVKDLAYVGQVHGNRVMTIKAGQDYRPRCKKDIIKGFDALVTTNRNLGLLVKLADCQGILLYDPVRKVVGVVHAGWRGSVTNVPGHTVARMREDFGSNPTDILAGIGPSLGPCHAEFVHHEHELPPAFLEYQVKEDHFDFWAISRDQLVEAGLSVNKIEISEMCTVCDREFYSYRRDKTARRFGLAAGLTP